MLAHRLFPKARYALWIDSKLKLQQPPVLLRRMFLPDHSGTILAVYRNLRRDHIDEERDWIWKHKCSGGVAMCPDLLAQWSEYEEQQFAWNWTHETVAIEGSMLLQDLRAPLHNVLFCGWFNEYACRPWSHGMSTRAFGHSTQLRKLQTETPTLNHLYYCRYVRHGERDQMAMDYLLHRMGLTMGGTNASNAIRLIGHTYHYLMEPSARPLTLVTKVGHRAGSRILTSGR